MIEATVLFENPDVNSLIITAVDNGARAGTQEIEVEWGKCQEDGCTNTCAKDATICYDHLALIFV